ncbi:MAG: hypothetical protein KJO01_10760 [Gammaproteobacteria bacterium]|nr:hypothetical protein [Gammaproteobacteria bacterium]MBT8111744.1 hypothetical protein [Gammaproteobacteria bacterium]NND47142.1 hypothetical protein [Woeseiaceae bacterium]NNL46443.1 hypothetical protein [Woeseiaceae bacterium]
MTTLDDLSGPSNRSLLLVHGRDFKPGHDAYLDLSVAALCSGIERDFPDLLGGFDAVHKDIVWYADLSEKILRGHGKKYDLELDIGDRRNALNTLREVKERKRFGIRQYDRLPGKSAIPEFLADLSAPVLGSVGLAMPLLGSVAKDFAAYFDTKRDFADTVRERMRTKLCELMDRGDRIMLITHGTGSVVAYDVLWQLSRDPAFSEQYCGKKVETWLTLGSPLGDRNVQKRLLGATEKTGDRFPANVVSWHNVAAEDDYTCHDNTLADDFKKMLKQRVVSAVHDYHVFNLAVRYGHSNPHSSVGYYIHPRTAKIISDWLK